MTPTTRSLLVASALAALVVAGASAAELPTTRSEPAKNVRKCNVAGMEGVLVPGSNVCVKVSGYVSGGVAAGNISK